MSFIAQKETRKRLKKFVLILLGLYVMVGSTLYFLQEKIIFRPNVLAQDHAYSFAYDFEELFLKAEDGAIINAIHFKVDSPKGVILYFHGNAGDLQRWGKITEYFVALGYDVFVMDYRTYGKSTGKLNEQNMYNDAQMCYNYLKDHYSEDEICVYGRSLGSGLACYIATINNPKQLVLETPYYSISDVAKYRFPIFPSKKILKYEFPNFEFIEKVNCKISMLHGTDDYVVPISSGKKLFESAPKEQSMFFTIDGGGHNNLIEFDQFTTAVNSIL